MQIEQLAIGCAVRGVDVRDVTSDVVRQVHDLVFRKRLVVLKDQTLDEQGLVDFAHQLGEPVPYLQANYHHPKQPLIFVSSNVKAADGTRLGVARTGGYWHSDTSFEAQPKTLTLLSPRILSKHSVRATRFIDMSEVYRALPESLKNALEGQRLLHSGRWRYKVRAEDAGFDITEILQMIDNVAPPTAHPALITHPYTGERVVYASRGFVIGIEGMSQAESSRILTELFDFAESPRFVRDVAWHLGDLILWDNRSLQHSSGRNASAASVQQQAREEVDTMMYRITIRDAWPLSSDVAPSLAAASINVPHGHRVC
jgi:taurine dioxygenase